MDTGPQSPTAVAEWVADVLRDRIVKGILAPGGRIVERTLSAELAVSRTPVREALKLLRAEGLIEISRYRGAQVALYSAEEADALFDVIAVLESLAVQRLAERITPAQLDPLEMLHEQMLGYFRAGQVEAYFDINSEIHDAIVRDCANPVLQDSHRRLMSRARRGRFMAIMDRDRLRQAVDEHEMLMVALRQGDAERAARIWRLHLLRSGEAVVAVLNSQRPAPDDKG